MLDIVIIGDKDGTRIKPLLKTFANDERFNIKIWAPVYLDSFSSEKLLQSDFDVSKSTIYMLRKLSLAEIGCVLAHNEARNFLATKEYGGVILEDDARIPNLDYFFDSATLFLDTIKIPSILNFAKIRKLENFDTVFPDIPVIQKENAYPPSAIAYVLNKPGAEILSKTKYRLCSVPDWPYANIKKFSLSNPAVAHGDAETFSTIDPENLLNRGVHSWKNRILLFSFYYYFKNRKIFGGLSEYIKVMLVHRFFYQFNKISQRFR